MGHLVASDWADKADDDPVFGVYKNCGLWTRDEAAILYNVALGVLGPWFDIGAHTGWTSAHIAEPGHYTHCIDPLLAVTEFNDRFRKNNPRNPGALHGWTSNRFFQKIDGDWIPAGVCIDGDHEPGKPLEDAQHAVEHLADTGVIMLHDGTGRPVREAVEFLIRERFHARVYYTPHLVFCCWRGDFKPPDHVPDPYVLREHTDGRYPDFDWSRLE